jgi:peptidyl-prolyl cis-trans isomerase SurA
VLFLLISGCSPKAGDAVVATVGKTPITMSEYEKLYERSNGSREAGVKATQEERERFLDLMVRYRKKLADAYDLGMDRRPELLAEIQQYKGSLAASYLTDRQLVTPALKKMYERSLEEIRASHIIVAVKPGATAQDSAAALKKINEVLELAKAGKDFGELAVTYSEDPSAKTNKGDLYYFSVGKMVPEFEEAAFAMKKCPQSPSPPAGGTTS